LYFNRRDSEARSALAGSLVDAVDRADEAAAGVKGETEHLPLTIRFARPESMGLTPVAYIRTVQNHRSPASSGLAGEPV
jgi:hypothetical protein